MNICDVFMAESQIAPAAYTRKTCDLFDDMNGENKVLSRKSGL